MKSEEMCERIAVDFLQKYVNSCKPNSVEDVVKALHKMMAVTVNAVDAVSNGKKETVQ